MARRPLALKGTLNAKVPGPTAERTILPTRMKEERALASEARFASRSTSRRPPAPALDTSNDPRTARPRCCERILTAVTAAAASGFGGEASDGTVGEVFVPPPPPPPGIV